MNKIKQFVLLSVGLLSLTACSINSNASTGEKVNISNVADKTSVNMIKEALSQHLPSENVEIFMEYVSDYNATIENTSLNKGFTLQEQPAYEVSKIITLWDSKKEDFIGTNCRINTYTLLKNTIEVPSGDYNDSLLFLDLDAINRGDLLSNSEVEEFSYLFSSVKTEDTTDIYTHITNMENHLSTIKFNEKARTISVVLLDDLDGYNLFIGHVGVLVESGDRYMFLEKLSFQEPYQAILFDTKEDCYKYLKGKYKDYGAENGVKAFIVDNDKVVLK